MAKLSGTKTNIMKKEQLIVPAVRALVPVSNWWKLKGADSSILKQTKVFKIKEKMSTQGVLVTTEGILETSTSLSKNYTQDLINSSGMTYTYDIIKAAQWDIAGKRHINGSSNQG